MHMKCQNFLQKPVLHRKCKEKIRITTYGKLQSQNVRKQDIAVWVTVDQNSRSSGASKHGQVNI